jgi:S-adenosyl-L-methionine hydrolase (adenosine-forming)
MSIVTLTTDFGIKDGNVGVMKGVIWGIAPDAQIADISHSISPQNIREGALILARSVYYYPSGSIHVAVVDPGVGTQRRPMAARIGAQRFVGPDNGLITLLLERAEREFWPVEIVHLDKSQYWLPEVSHVFHGRDIFAPAAGYLAAGVSLEMLGSPIDDPVRLQLLEPERTESGLRGEVIHIDHFGNISTNIRHEHLGEGLNVTVRLGGIEVHGLVKTFGERPAGELIALYGSTGNLLVAVVNGSASEKLNTKVGDEVEIDVS